MGIRMNVHEKIRKLRETKHWSQEEMAERMSMSLNGYAKLNVVETKLHLDKLEQIAQILDIDIVELINSGERNVFVQFNENSHFGSSFQGDNEKSLLIEIEKLKLSLSIVSNYWKKRRFVADKLVEQKIMK